MSQIESNLANLTSLVTKFFGQNQQRDDEKSVKENDGTGPSIAAPLLAALADHSRESLEAKGSSRKRTLIFSNECADGKYLVGVFIFKKNIVLILSLHQFVVNK